MTTTIPSFTNTLGPLTTAWAPPASCTTGLVSSSSELWQDQSCVGDIRLGGNPSCWPPRTEAAASLSGALSTWGIYSPATLCPSGKVPVCSYDGSKNSGGFQFYFPPGPSETAIGCCPSGFFCYGKQKCALFISSSTVPTMQCSDGEAVDPATLSIPYTTTEDSSAATISTFTAIAPLLQLMYQSSDISTTTSSSSSDATATSSGQGTSSSGGQGLSTGASAGIGVGVGLGVVILAAAAFWFWRTRRKISKAASPDHRPNADHFRDGRAGDPEPKSRLELQGNSTVSEMSSHMRLQDSHEMDGRQMDAPRVQQASPVELS